MAAVKKMPALGRGMNALIPSERREEGFREIEVDRLDPNPFQPRSHFDQDTMTELANSIKSNGVLQPILVRAVADRYQICHGERRFRASLMAGLKRIPAVVRRINDREMHVLGLVENLQRDDLDPIEEAVGFQALLQAHSMTQEEISDRVGKDRTTITNSLRLLRLPTDVQDYLRDGRLMTGHAKALLGCENDGDIRKAARKIMEESLNVRQAERLVRSLTNRKQPRKVAENDPNTRAAEEALMRVLKTKVEIHRVRRGGRIVIGFHSEEELDRLYSWLTTRKTETIR